MAQTGARVGLLDGDIYGPNLPRMMGVRQMKLMAGREGIVPVHTVDEAEGVPFLVMPLLEGESLHQRLSRGPLNRREARRITLEVASALRAAHACGL